MMRKVNAFKDDWTPRDIAELLEKHGPWSTFTLTNHGKMVVIEGERPEPETKCNCVCGSNE